MDATQLKQAIEFFAELPSSTLRRCVGDALVINDDDYDQLRKQMPEDPLEVRRALAEAIVERHNQVGRIAELLQAAGRLVYRDVDHYARLAPLIRDLCNLNANQQAALVMRAHTLPLGRTLEFFEVIAGKLCVIAATNAAGDIKFGTGLLVGVDRVLTAYHTLRDHILGGEPAPMVGGTLCALFEHSGIAPIVDPNHPPKGVLRVDFHQEWLLCSCEDMPGDGQFAHPSKEQLSDLPNRLDFALIRLAEPIGNRTREFAGGRRRQWWDINQCVSDCLNDDQIIIPQHPGGMPQRISFGRYRRDDTDLDTSKTRIRYNTEADKGSSGAPCFNHEFKFVGLHNAAFYPVDLPTRLNQAVRGDCILAKLVARGVELPAPGAASELVPLWSVSNDPATPQPILGRRALLEWIDRAADDTVPAGNVCAYFARDAEEVAREGIGLSFTTQILLAARAHAGSSEPIVVLGGDEPIPPLAEDFVALLTHHLRLPPSELRTLPRRPDGQRMQPASDENSGLPAGTPVADIDKLDKWKSDDLPGWLNLALRAPEQSGKESRELSRYRRIWIALDNLHRVPLSAEVEDVIAGLMSSNRSGTSLHPHLHGIRWLFLGQAPRIALHPSTQSEVLDPSLVGMHEINTALECMRSCYERNANEFKIASFAIEVWLEERAGGLADAGQRLRMIQGRLSHFAAKVHAHFGKP